MSDKEKCSKILLGALVGGLVLVLLINICRSYQYDRLASELHANMLNIDYDCAHCFVKHASHCLGFSRVNELVQGIMANTPMTSTPEEEGALLGALLVCSRHHCNLASVLASVAPSGVQSMCAKWTDVLACGARNLAVISPDKLKKFAKDYAKLVPDLDVHKLPMVANQFDPEVMVVASNLLTCLAQCQKAEGVVRSSVHPSQSHVLMARANATPNPHPPSTPAMDNPVFGELGIMGAEGHTPNPRMLNIQKQDYGCSDYATHRPRDMFWQALHAERL
jgi:hypothetical protein